MRAFVAVVPPSAALAPLEQLAAAARTDHPELGWIAPERRHVTLAFLGEQPEPRLARLGPRLAAVAAGMPPFHLRVAGAGAFPSPQRARVVWAGLDGDVDALHRLAADVARAARAARMRLDAKPFRPHVTLARVRRAGFAGGEQLVARLGRASGPEFAVGEIVLFRSHLGPRPRYERLDGWPLGGHQA